ncbi:MAG TPA: hypothetical protein ENF94_02045 [Candidatus Woesearchaeota archaeon]|nr:hypothetical protein [Candidatus Woesearchaeota archaeon]
MRSKSRFFVFVLLSAFIFLLGFGLGNHFALLDGGINKILKESELNAESFLVEQQLSETLGSNCVFSQERLSALSEQLWDLGKMLDKESARKDLGEKWYDLLKRKFHLMQIKTYVLYKKLEQNCGKDFDVILFYFKRDNPDSKQQGEILDRIVDDFGAKVFAVEFGYAPELRFLEQYYGIDSAPALVINFDKKLEGLQSYDVIKKILENS